MSPELPRDAEERIPLVLVIDDDQIQRRLARAAIQRCGIGAEEAADGATGVEAFRACAQTWLCST